MDDATGEVVAAVVELTEVNLADLSGIGSAALARTLAAIRDEEAEDAQGRATDVHAGWQSVL